MLAVQKEEEAPAEVSAVDQTVSKVESLAQKMAQADNVTASEGEKLGASPESISSVPAVGTLSDNPGGGKRYLLIFLIVLLILGLIGGGVYIYRRTLSQKEAAPEVTPTPELQVEESPEASPAAASGEAAAALDRADLAVEILNGSGIAGLAGEASSYLEGLGYTDVKTGNAGSYDYEQTEIAIKQEKQAYLSLLISDLEEEYSLAEKTSVLDADSDFDVVITLGKE